MSAAKRKKIGRRPFDYAAETVRNHQDFLDSVKKMLPQMTDEQVFQLIKDVAEEL